MKIYIRTVDVNIISFVEHFLFLTICTCQVHVFSNIFLPNKKLLDYKVFLIFLTQYMYRLLRCFL